MPDISEKEFINTEIARMKGELGTLPQLIQSEHAVLDEKIDAILKEADVFDAVQEIREHKKKVAETLNAQGNQVKGAVIMLTQILEKYHTPPPPTADDVMPLPEGVTHMHGIDLTKLDAKGRYDVMNGNQEAIEIIHQSMANDSVEDPEDEVSEIEDEHHGTDDAEDNEEVAEFVEWAEDDIEDFLIDETDQEEAPHIPPEEGEEQVRSLLERYSARDLHE